MSNTPPVVTIFGGSGFVGRYITHRMARSGWRVRVATRRPHEAIFVKQFGDVGQVEPILANIRDEESTKRAIAGADAVINCTAISYQSGKQKFETIHVEAAGRIARLAAAEGISKLIHISALSADENGPSEYGRSKAAGEEAVRDAFPNATIVRPSVVFGTEDKFFNRFAALSRLTPILPIVGADSKFQPVYVEDIAVVVEKIATNGISGKVFELGGPDVATFRQLMEKMLDVIQRKRLVISVPTWIARTKAWFFEIGSIATGGLFAPLVTRDQIALASVDNVVSEGAAGFADLGIVPTAMDGVIEEYLYCYRTKGQYSKITQSGKNLGT